MLLARMISRQKWPNEANIPTCRVRADAITSDLRTESDKISLWEVKRDPKEDLEQVALAIAAGRSDIDRLDLTWIDSEDPSMVGIELTPSPGRTPVRSLRDRHVDAVSLDYSGLGAIATAIVRAIDKEHSKRWSKKEILCLLTTAVKRNEIDIAAMSPNLRQALGCTGTD